MSSPTIVAPTQAPTASVRVVAWAMENADFDPSERIAGFPLLSIKRALGWVGITDDRDDVALVAEALSCPRPQAERVLTAAERRGLVTPTAAKNQWKTTPLGWQLAVHWKPPSSIEPAIALDDDEDSKAINEIFDDVPCSILRSPDDGDAFEEAKLGVGVFVEYESPRVIEISVSIPDDYDHPESSANIESSVYIGVDDAKRFAKALETAIKRAESEVARRAKLKTRKKRAGRAASASEEKQGGARGAAAKAEAGADAAKRKEARAAEKKRKDEQRALDATLKELREAGKRGKSAARR